MVEPDGDRTRQRENWLLRQGLIGFAFAALFVAFVIATGAAVSLFFSSQNSNVAAQKAEGAADQAAHASIQAADAVAKAVMAVTKADQAQVSAVQAKQLAAAIQQERRDTILGSCNDQNARNRNTRKALAIILNKAKQEHPGERVQLAESRASTLFLINALVPLQDCKALAKREASRP